ncbi:MAG: archaea-specific SMC-related protein [Halorientalis sp.]
MSSQREAQAGARLSVENVGGIDGATVTFRPGVNVLVGRNATNRTSTLRALMAALGSDDAALKGDADEGAVELDLDGETYRRTLRRRGGSVVTGGSPYLDDPTLADLYAFLLESNEARRAVARGGDLREVIMRPVDTEAIRAEIDRLEHEKREVSERLDELDTLADRRDELAVEREELTQRLSEVEADLEDAQAELAAADADVEETRAEKAELDERLSELGDVRTELEDVRYDLETERDSVDRLRTDLAEQRSALEEFPETGAEEVEALERELGTLRERKRTLEADIGELQSIVQFNQDVLAEGGPAEVDALRADGSAGTADAVTDELLADGTDVTCWTCGTTVETSRIEATTERLREFLADKRAERDDLSQRIDECQAERREIEDRREERERLEQTVAETEAEIERREERVADLEERREELESRVDELEAEVASLEDADYDAVLERQREVDELTFERDRLAERRDSVAADIADIEERLAERETLEQRREDLAADLADARARADRIEESAVEAFNDHMAEILDRLDYANVDRIWLERVTRSTDGRPADGGAVFELHVVRTTPDGAAYEDTVEHLSESEREVTGLVFALAGYLVHDVHEVAPFVLLDSLEAIDADRIAALVEYFADYADYLVVALLPEDAAALEDDYTRITDI